MELPSAPAQRGPVPWLGLLLTALLLTFWSPPTAAQYRYVPVDIVPPNALRGKQVLLIPHTLSDKYYYLFWYREDLDPYNHIAGFEDDSKFISKGPQYRTRHTLYSNGSLLIRNLKKADEGKYQLRVFTLRDEYEIAEVELRVYEPEEKPSILFTYAEVELTCVPYASGVSVQWYFNDKEMQHVKSRKLSSDNRTLTLVPYFDFEGDFQCAAFNPASSTRSAHIRVQIPKSQNQ